MSATKIALITGCSRGVGLGLVKEYVSRGYQVVATCRNPENATALKEFLTEVGQKSAMPLDVSCKSSIEACCLAINKENKKIDLLINNAGISNKEHPDDLASNTDATEFDHIMHTNVTSCLSMTQAFLPLLRKSQEPMVINISSGLGSLTQSPRFSTTSYQCSKAAINMLTKCFADDVKDVKFVAMHPGWVQTDMGNSKNRNAPVTIADSAKGIANVASEVTLAQSGIFMGFDGSVIGY